MTDAEKTALRHTLSGFAGAATLAASALPEPAATVVRLVSAAFGAASAMLLQGATPEQAVAAVKRVRHIDTSADDTAVDAKIDVKVRAEKLYVQGPAIEADAPTLWERMELARKGAR